jgi:hypothetical protein
MQLVQETIWETILLPRVHGFLSRNRTTRIRISRNSKRLAEILPPREEENPPAITTGPEVLVSVPLPWA